MNRLTITSEDVQRMRDAHRPLLGADPYSEDCLVTLREVAGSSIPKSLMNKLYALRSRKSASGCLLVEGLTDQAELPPTPVQAGAMPQHELTLISELMELGLALVLGEPLAYQAEKTGALVQHVFPIRSEKDSPSNESSASMLDLHTELVFSRRHRDRPLGEDSPDFLLLLCNRSDPGCVATTLVADIADLCAKTPPAQLAVLQQPRFKLKAPYSFTLDDPGDRPWVGPVPLIGGTAATPSAAFDLACGTRGLDAEAERALDALREVASSPGVIARLRLKPGNLLILDNRRCVHGRTPFSAVYDGSDRWLQRIYVRLSLQNMQALDARQSSRVF